MSSRSVQIHTVLGTGVLQQFVDRQQLPDDMDGDLVHCHSDWLAFRLVGLIVSIRSLCCSCRLDERSVDESREEEKVTARL